MLYAASQKLVSLLAQAGIVTQDKRELYEYGFRSLFLQCINMGTVCVIGISFGMIMEAVCFTTAFLLLRTYAGGVHARSPQICYIFSSGMLIAVLLICKFVPDKQMLFMSVILAAPSLPTILLLAPVDTPNKPLDEAEYRHFRKTVLRRLWIMTVAWVVLLCMMQYLWCLLLSLAWALIAILLIIGNWCNQRRKHP